MKKIISLFVLLTLVLCSCTSDPEVTASYKVSEYPNYLGNINFKGRNPDSYLLFDGNKRCPYDRDHAFCTFKNSRSASILKTDYCAHCPYTWSKHVDK